MNIAYKKLATGEWFVEAWMYTSDWEMVHTSCTDRDRRTASWKAFSALSSRFPVSWAPRW
jgi:hypothetical protein